MTQEPSEHPPGVRWDVAERVLSAEAPPDWAALTAPLDDAKQSDMIERALARRRVASRKGSAPPRTILHRLKRALPLVAAAAVVAFALVPQDPALGPIEFDTEGGRALVRGESPAPDGRVQLSLRNEPGWTVRLPQRDATRLGEAWQLYVAAEGARSVPRLLNAQVERRGAALRVLGELHVLGLSTEDVTIHFIVGPRDAGDAALSVVQRTRAGEGSLKSWAVRSMNVHITE